VKQARLLVIAFAVVLAGCGGGRSQDEPHQATAVLTLRIVWPPTTGEVLPQLVPALSRSVVVTIRDEDLVLAARTAVRPQGPPWTTEISIEGLPACDDAILSATAHPNDDGTGVAQAQASTRLVIPARGAAYPADGSPGDEIVLNMASTITQIAIRPSPATVQVGETLQLTATAKNAQGQTVFVPPQNAFEWSVVGASADIIVQSASVSVDDDGLVEGLSPGVASVQARERESGVSGTTSVQVTQAPTIGDSLEVSMNLDFFDVVRDPDLWDLGDFEQEVHDMMAQSAAAGVRRILYRVTACGEVMYPSDFLTPFNGTAWGPNSGEVYSQRTTHVVDDLAPLATCVDAAHAHGLQIWAWICLFDRAYSAGNLWDDWLRDNPKYWWRQREADGYSLHEVWFGMPCNAYPEVRQHQVAEVQELLTRYDLDGLFFSLRKHGGVVAGTGSPNFDYGFNAPVIEEYMNRWGEDPREVVDGPDSEAGRRFSQLKGDYFTQLMREIRHAAGNLPIMLMYGYHTCDIGTDFAYVDTRAIFDENLADEICLWRTSRSNALAAAGQAVKTTGWYRIYDWAGEWTRDQKVAAMEQAVRSALQAGEDGITFHEQHEFEQDDLYADLGAILHEPL